MKKPDNKAYLKEKREFPRSEGNLELTIPEATGAEPIDFSEGGISFSSQEIISSPLVSLAVKFPGKNLAFEARAQLVWQRDSGSGDSVYGVKFIKLEKFQKQALRKELVENQLKKLTQNIADQEVKNYILRFFSQDILDYINKITELKTEYQDDSAYSLELEKKLEDLNNKILLKGYCLELLLSDKKVLRKIKESFRDLAGAWVYKSAIVKQAFDKPQGYPESYSMLDLIYKNKPVSKNIGLYFDNIFLKSPYSVAIRNRKTYLTRKIIDFVNQSDLKAVKVLGLCSGTGCEALDASSLFNPLKKVEFTFVETDKRAIDFLSSSFSQKSNKNISACFKLEPVYKLLEKKQQLKEYGLYQVIYSLGIIDYLSDRSAKKVIKILYGLLQENGRLILTHRNKDKTFPPIPPDWLCDWRVISRNKEEMSRLIYQSGIKCSLAAETDNFGYVHYFILTKNSL